MIFKYKVITQEGKSSEGTIDAPNQDGAVSSLQRRGFVVVSIAEEKEKDVFESVGFKNPFEKVKEKDVVIVSRQIATLFDAGVSALKAFRILASEGESKLLKKHLSAVADDIQSGVSISNALAKQDKVFSAFYVNMVRAGEESGKLNETFAYLADYLDRNYELTSKTKNALIYPAFVIGTFFVVMILMLTMVIPKLAVIIKDSGQAIPVYTKAVIWMSEVLVNYGFMILIAILASAVYFFYFKNNDSNSDYFDELKLTVPFIKDLYSKLYYSRICDNLDTMLSSGVSIVRALDITSRVVDNKIYEKILINITEDVKGGSSLSESMRRHPEMPNILVQMITIGEETGKLGDILKNLAFFYKREVNGAVDTLVSLIEPIMIVALGLGVGTLLASVLVPIYNVAGSI
jgi:type IV pilus assembly protein PilC